MCTICGIKTNAAVGSVVRISRRCNKRNPAKDKGAHLVRNQTLVYVARMAPRGEGIYGHIINDGIKQGTECHFRDCEYVTTNMKWVNGQLI